VGTRSFIGVLNEDETVKAIYCHWDGYPEHNGRILQGHYRSITKIQQLLDLGDLSILGEEIGEQHDFEKRGEERAENWCSSYARDRGEEDVEARVYENIVAFMKGADDYDAQYAYLFKSGEWWVSRTYPSHLLENPEWQRVEDVLEAKRRGEEEAA
jgi:hypothetical protein